MTTEANHPTTGGSYFQAAPDAKPVFVEGTNRPQTPEEKAAEQAARKAAEVIEQRRAADETARKATEEAAKKSAEEPAGQGKPADATSAGKTK